MIRRRPSLQPSRAWYDSGTCTHAVAAYGTHAVVGDKGKKNRLGQCACRARPTPIPAHPVEDRGYGPRAHALAPSHLILIASSRLIVDAVKSHMHLPRLCKRYTRDPCVDAKAANGNAVRYVAGAPRAYSSPVCRLPPRIHRHTVARIPRAMICRGPFTLTRGQFYSTTTKFSRIRAVFSGPDGLLRGPNFGPGEHIPRRSFNITLRNKFTLWPLNVIETIDYKTRYLDP